MRPLNYAILKLFTEDDTPRDKLMVMEELKDEYGHFRTFKPAIINEVLLCGDKNGFLAEDHYDTDENNTLRVYYTATDEHKEIINKWIK